VREPAFPTFASSVSFALYKNVRESVFPNFASSVSFALYTMAQVKDKVTDNGKKNMRHFMSPSGATGPELPEELGTDKKAISILLAVLVFLFAGFVIFISNRRNRVRINARQGIDDDQDSDRGGNGDSDEDQDMGGGAGAGAGGGAGAGNNGYGSITAPLLVAFLTSFDAAGSVHLVGMRQVDFSEETWAKFEGKKHWVGWRTNGLDEQRLDFIKQKGEEIVKDLRGPGKHPDAINVLLGKRRNDFLPVIKRDYDGKEIMYLSKDYILLKFAIAFADGKVG
jgi:hypothetical protein